MAVEKMEIVSIIGPIDDFDRIAVKYILGNNIHLESMFSLLESPKGLYPFNLDNPYTDTLKNITATLRRAGIQPEDIPEGRYDMAPDRIEQYGKTVDRSLTSLLDKKQELQENIQENEGILYQLEHIKNVDIELSELFNFKFIKVRFGKMPRDAYAHMDHYLQSYDTFFFKFDEDRDYVFGVYFAPAVMHEKIDSIFSSLYFQRSRISDRADGTPMQVIQRLTDENKRFETEIKAIDTEIKIIADREHDKLCTAYRSAKCLYDAYGVRKYAAHTKESFYIGGWMPVDEITPLKESLNFEPNITLLVEKAELVKNITPPTKLKNWKLFKPFESFVEMYGLPAYNEIDPTIIFALTYSIMFGIMYGDVGHGLVLGLVGLVMAKRKLFLGPILEICGIVSIVFGLLYGSIFGYEHLIPTLWYKPMGDSGSMMSTLIMSVAFGVVLITIAMILNMINGVRQKNIGKMLLDPNGLAGFIFYWAVIIGVLSVIMGNSVMEGWYIALFVVVPLVVVFLKEPLAKLLEKRKDWMPKNKGEYILETFFEMFEVILSYITNTISFIRVGAFALNHAGMLAVVFTLSEMAKGASSILVIIIGNIIVLGLEGLLVAIQVLRLQFYEMFSRYYSGTGKPFKKYGDA